MLFVCAPRVSESYLFQLLFGKTYLGGDSSYLELRKGAQIVGGIHL